MAGLISPGTIEQIRGANDIVDVISGYIPLRKAGANFVAVCPFHREKTPSFNVSPHRQIFHCFGCHKGGDVFRFVQDYENLPFVDAVRRLAQRANIPLEYDQQPGARQAQHLKDTLRQIHEQVTQRWHQALLNDAAGEPARAYLQKRGLSDDAIKLFRLGYAPEAWDDTVNWGRSKEYDAALLEQAGLVLHKEDSQRYYDRFRGRLIFPICDEQGRVIGFSGRLLAEDAKAAKYVNSPETPIFTKGRVLFGLDKAKRAMLDQDVAVICEGQLDMIACFTHGLENVIAPQGTALTAEQARILKRYVAEVVLCFDSDSAGQAAAVRSYDSLLEAGLAVRVMTIPSPHDPDSFIRTQGPEALRALLDRAEGYFDFLLERLCLVHDIKTDKGRLSITRDMALAVQKTRSLVLLDTYAQKTALRLGIASDAVRQEFKKTSQGQRQPEYDEREDQLESAVPEARPSQPEFWLLRNLFRDDAPLDWTSAHLDLDWLQHRIVRSVVAARLAAHREQSWTGVAAFLSSEFDPATQSLITEAVTEERVADNTERNVQEILLRLRNQSIDRELAQTKARVSLPSLAQSEMEKLLRRQAELRQLKLTPLLPLPSGEG